MSQLVSNYIFEAVEQDKYCHNAFSRSLLNKSLAAWIHFL
jgi:hypothetical protein